MNKWDWKDLNYDMDLLLSAVTYKDSLVMIIILSFSLNVFIFFLD